MGKKLLILILSCIIISNTMAAEEIYFQFTTGDKEQAALPFRVEIRHVNLNEDSVLLKAFRIDGQKIIPLKSQLETGEINYLWIQPDRPIPPNTTLKIRVDILNSPAPATPLNHVDADKDNFTMYSGKDKILSYKHSYTPAPEGADSLYGKSGYIHPLYSPSGNIMTSIQLPDHYHHYGIWNPWTKIHIGGKEMDLWNLVKKQGTVRFGGLASRRSGELFSSLEILQEHVEYREQEPERIILNEKWKIRSFPVEIQGTKCWLIDLDVELNNAIDETIEFVQYRYGGGLGFRANADWTNENSSMITSAGKTRKDADASKARWALLEGEFSNGSKSGILLCSHPGNREHPEPMRMWPPDAVSGKGYVFFEYTPIRHRSWFIEAGKSYALKYRMLVFDNKLSPETAESVWQHFAYPLRPLEMEK